VQYEDYAPSLAIFPLLTVQELMGHKTIEMTVRYYLQTVDMCSECSKSLIFKARVLVNST